MIEWRGNSVEERGIDAKTGKVLIEIDPRYFRPTEVDILLGDATKARQKLGWTPTITFRQLISEMVAADRDAVRFEHRRLDRDGL
jgi:GDPmannose 4,6-dehydratase